MEGLETPQQVSTLKRLTCQYGQGYWFGKPQTATDIEAWLMQASTHYRPHPVS